MEGGVKDEHNLILVTKRTMEPLKRAKVFLKIYILDDGGHEEGLPSRLKSKHPHSRKNIHTFLSGCNLHISMINLASFLATSIRIHDPK